MVFSLKHNRQGTASISQGAPRPRGERVYFPKSPRLDLAQVHYARTIADDAQWNTTVVREVMGEEVQQLKAQPGGDLVIGGADLAATFMRHGLIDELRIYVHPVVIGQGRSLFPPGHRLNIGL